MNNGGEIILTLDRTRMSANLDIIPPRASAEFPDLAFITGFLKEKGVCFGVQEEEIVRGLDRAFHSGQGVRVVAARGRPPVSGHPGRIEWLLEIESDPAPALQTNGQVDFKSLSLIKRVDEGQPLVRRHPPSPGEDGMDVFGAVILASSGDEIPLPQGPNTRVAAEDANLLVAAVSGLARLSGEQFEVSELLTIPRNVDYSSGNIHYGKTVIVRGDVKSGFDLVAGGDLEIWGLAEDCRIKAAGNVLVKSGFTGTGKGFLEAGGDVGLGYVRNQTIRVAGKLSILREALNSTLRSRSSITISGQLAGGSTWALDHINCQVAGTDGCVPTELVVGVDYFLVEAKTETEKQVSKLTAYLRTMEAKIRELEETERRSSTLSSKSIDLLFELERMKAKVLPKLAQLEGRTLDLSKELVGPHEASISIAKMVHPGVIIRVRDAYSRIDVAMPGPKTFVLKEGNIKIL